MSCGGFAVLASDRARVGRRPVAGDASSGASAVRVARRAPAGHARAGARSGGRLVLGAGAGRLGLDGAVRPGWIRKEVLVAGCTPSEVSGAARVRRNDTGRAGDRAEGGSACRARSTAGPPADSRRWAVGRAGRIARPPRRPRCRRSLACGREAARRASGTARPSPGTTRGGRAGSIGRRARRRPPGARPEPRLVAGQLVPASRAARQRRVRLPVGERAPGVGKPRRPADRRPRDGRHVVRDPRSEDSQRGLLRRVPAGPHEERVGDRPRTTTRSASAATAWSSAC